MISTDLRFKHVGLSSDGTVVFCEMDNGSTYSMPLRALEEAERCDSCARPEGAGILQDGYAAFVDFYGGVRIEFPSNLVLDVCAPASSYYRDTGRTDSGIGGLVRKVRQARGLTLDALAAKCGIAKPNLSRLENDKVTPTFKTLHAVAAALDTHPALLMCTKKPGHAWTWTRHAFTEWKLALLWKEGGGGSFPIPIRALDMVNVFLATRPEHAYARTELLRHAVRAPHDPELCKMTLDANKWEREVASAEAARARAKGRGL